ncbi:outer membrane protein OmpK [Thauera sp.]|uniref:outer membrane protein OmpK n=1 Tax=Thauera sp. TaxID=1905334 RepID=UPI002CD29E98|nr:outer membrane protein OmpK [Thauera sp.]HRP26012.1 outer membrane protein OmpK [Thauera sp.]
MIRNKRLAALLTSCGVALGMATAYSAHAVESWQNTNVNIGYTTNSKFDPVFGTGTEDKKLTTVRLEHFGVHEYGDNYFFFDTYHGKGVGNFFGDGAGSFGEETGNQYFGVWNPRLSLSRISGKDLSFGIIKDVNLAARLERGSYANFRADNLGLAFDLDVPGFSFFETDFYGRRARFTGDGGDAVKTLFWRTFAILPFEFGGFQFTWSPLLLVNFNNEERGTTVFVQPDLWLKINSHFDIGYRHEYARYSKTDAEGGGTYSRHTPTLQLRWNF